MAGGLMHLWKEWEIQILVLLSYILQVILLFLAGIRRRKGFAVLRVLLWLAYLMADSTAIYTLGHLSISTRSREHQLVAFWAPFLLLHLGGPDNITAYALEDNRLWLRHLLTLVVQVLGVAYILYQSIASGGTFVPAAILMFVAGLLKYGERTWALKCANMDSIESSLDFSDGNGGRHPYCQQDKKGKLDAEEVLLGAHYVFNVCKSLFVNGLTMSVSEYEAIARGIQFDGDKHMYELIEMELSIMYDILYTKAAVIHTWHGCCIRVVSLLATATAFFLFQLNSRDAYNRVDVTITYVLLVGAFVLEMTAVFRAIGSSWTCAFLHARGWDWPYSAVMFLRRFVQAGRSRRWLDSIGQYNLLDFCTRDTTELRGKIAKTVGLEDWWNKLHYSGTVSISTDIKKLVLKEIPKRGLGDVRNARGRSVAFQNGIGDDLSWCLDDIDFEKSVLVWHVATGVYLCCCEEVKAEAAAAPMAKAIKELSNYMVYLVVLHPDMLPGPIRRGRYPEICDNLVELWREHSTGEEEGRNYSKSEKLARLLLDKFGGPDTEVDEHGQTYLDGAALAGILLRNEWHVPDMLGLIGGVWFEMLCFAAHHCSEDSHARQLSSGGEFLTVVWLLVEYTGMYNFTHNGATTSGVADETSQENDDIINCAAADISVEVDGISGAAAEIELHDISGAAAEITAELDDISGVPAEISEEHVNVRLDG